MSMTEAEKLNELKSYLRIDTDDDDELLETLMSAGVTFLEKAGVDYSDEAEYRLALMKYVKEQYDNRDATKNEGYTNAMTGMIIQLRGGL